MVSQISLRGTHITIHQLKKYEILEFCFFIFNFIKMYQISLKFVLEWMKFLTIFHC